MKKSILISSIIAAFTNTGFAATPVEHVCVNNPSVFSIEVGVGGLYSRGSSSMNWIGDFQGSLEMSSCDRWSGFVGLQGFYGYKGTYDYGLATDAIPLRDATPATATTSIVIAAVTPATTPPTLSLTYPNNRIISTGSVDTMPAVVATDASMTSKQIFVDVIKEQGIKTWGGNILIGLCKNICISKEDVNTKTRKNQTCDCNHMNVGIVGGFIWDNFETKSTKADEKKVFAIWKKTSAKDWTLGVRLSGEFKTSSVAIVPSLNIMAQLYPKTTVTGTQPTIVVTTTATSGTVNKVNVDSNVSQTLDRSMRATIIGDIKIAVEMSENTYVGVVPFIDWSWRSLKDEQTDVVADGYKLKDGIIEDNIKFGLNVSLCYIQ